MTAREWLSQIEHFRNLALSYRREYDKIVADYGAVGSCLAPKTGGRSPLWTGQMPDAAKVERADDALKNAKACETAVKIRVDAIERVPNLRLRLALRLKFVELMPDKIAADKFERSEETYQRAIVDGLALVKVEE